MWKGSSRIVMGVAVALAVVHGAVAVPEVDPAVQVVVPEFLNETDQGQRVQIGVDYWDPSCNGTITARVEVAEYRTGVQNPGALRLDLAYASQIPGEENVYYVELSATRTSVILAIESMDGTAASSMYGFEITVSIVASSVNYIQSRSRVYVNNAAPVCSATPENGTNCWTTAKTINWSINDTGDTAPDFAGVANFPGIHVELTGDLTNPVDEYITEGKSFSVTPDFGNSAPGLHFVLLTVTDKDGGMFFAEYRFDIPPNKFLTTIATGPGGGRNISISRAYARASGLGAGHVFVSGTGVAPLSASSFAVFWNCKSLNAVDIYAFGYHSGAVDNGTLDSGRDTPMTPFGSLWTDGDYYTYNNAYDSFPYAWIVPSTSNETSVASYEVIASPKIVGDAAQLAFNLPNIMSEDDIGYPASDVEAVFSKEWLPADNCGDINQDGIPDRALVDYDFGIAFDGREDLVNLSSYNAGHDFLPSASTRGNSFVSNFASATTTEGVAFNALLEIRGFGIGLNAGYPNADGGNPAPDYSVNEKRAWLEWKSLATFEALREMPDASVAALFDGNIADAMEDLAAANRNEGGWSPERSTDPTEVDTDKDGLSDGYEYWFWYGAKVGYYDQDPANGGKWQGRMKGRRRNLNGGFEVIAPDEIASAFDPQVAAIDVASRDFDGDGLLDSEEFLFGTSPVDCDTDNDGVLDGDSVMPAGQYYATVDGVTWLYELCDGGGGENRRFGDCADWQCHDSV